MFWYYPKQGVIIRDDYWTTIWRLPLPEFFKGER